LLSDSVHKGSHDLVELFLLVDDFRSVDSSGRLLVLLLFFLAISATRPVNLGIKVLDVVFDHSNGGVDLGDA